MTADIDLLSTNAEALAEALRALLADRFRIAVRVREITPGAFRVYQLCKPKNRRLVHVRQVAAPPPFREFNGVRVLEPADLAAMKAIAIASRGGHEKGLSDKLDLHRLLRAFPELGAQSGPVPARVQALGGDSSALAAWAAVAREPLEIDDEVDD
ncbi:MAG TPA: hypothetical protein VGM29_06215 [Polyangiaceae bacterium]|jgi:hypothetical protein